jgi:hypothetical protein
LPRLLTALLVLFVAHAASAARKCKGNACSAITITFDDECYTVTNKDGSRKVKVTLSTGPASVSKVLKPGKQWKPDIFGTCIKSFVHPYKAKFKD